MVIRYWLMVIGYGLFESVIHICHNVPSLRAFSNNK